MRVRVTTEDIGQGKPGIEEDCPVVLAMKRTGLVKKCRVEGDVVYWTDRYGRQSTRMLPAIAVAFVRDFHEGRPVSPIEFFLKED